MTDTVAQPVEIKASEETVGSIIDELTTEKPKFTIESEAGVYEAGETAGIVETGSQRGFRKHSHKINNEFLFSRSRSSCGLFTKRLLHL